MGLSFHEMQAAAQEMSLRAVLDEDLSNYTLCDDGRYEVYTEYTDDAVSEVDKHKNITVNEEQCNLTQEENSQYVPFKLPRYWDGVDLMTKLIQFHYVNINGGSGISTAVNVRFNDSYIICGWLINKSVTAVAGDVTFEITATGTNEKSADYRWRTRPNGKFTVLEALSYDGIIEPSDDWYAGFVKSMQEYTTKAAESARSAQDYADQSKSNLDQVTQITETFTTNAQEVKETAINEINNAKVSGVNAVEAAATEIVNDREKITENANNISSLKGDIDAINTATDENIGKVLKVKNVEGGRVTEWEFGEYTAENILYSDDEQYSENTVGKTIRTINDALNFPLKKELTDYDVTDGLYVNGIIANKTTDSRWQSTILDVTEGEQYEIYSYLNSSSHYLWAFANGGEFVSRSQYRGNPAGYYNETITIPDGVNQLVISWWAANEHHIYKIGVDKIGELEEKVNKIPSDINDAVDAKMQSDIFPYLYPKKGKKVVWFGTSIADGYRIPNTIDTSYPKKIADLTWMDIDNQAVGASCLRGGDYKSKTENDPYGMSTTPYNFLMKSMCIPSSVKQNWFDDWETYKTIIPYAPDTISDSNKKLFLSCSYDKKLDPYLVDDNVPDLFVLDFGYNERVGNGFDDEMLAIPDDEYDITYPMGAFNFIVNRILSKQPKAKIALVGLYENDNKKQVAKLQQMYADKWNLPFIKLWEHLGWTQNKITVTGEWQVDSTYPALYHWVETGAEKQMTLMDRFVPDKIHPYSDASGESNQKIANVLAEWISHLNF